LFDAGETQLLDSDFPQPSVFRIVTLRSSERHQLKQDQFAVKTQETLDWAAEHRNPLTYGLIAIALVLAIGAGAFYYQQNREQKASAMLGDALLVFNAPLRQAGTPETPGVPSFLSAAERARAASEKLLPVTQKYSHTDAATLANYFLGLSAEDMNDNAKAEQFLKVAADSGNKDTSALAKSALAALYHGTGRDQDAINLYQQLIAKPTNTISKASAQMSLAGLYETKNPTEARKLYEEVIKDKDNAAQVVSLANTKIAALKTQ
jgi:tetratricopeptide (TPR) repeat protein